LCIIQNKALANPCVPAPPDAKRSGSSIRVEKNFGLSNEDSNYLCFVKPSFHLHLHLIFFVALLAACTSNNHLSDNTIIPIHDEYFNGHAQFAYTSKGFRISLFDAQGTKLDQAIFNYQAYQLDTSDVDRDGRTDLIVGLIKPTEFDPHEKKRLFILRIDEGQLRPLWLGSKVCQQLVDFRPMANGVVRTLEKTKDGNYAIGLYEWQGFGLTLIEYTGNEKPYHEALAIFNG
jgi:hypothetical protein